MGHIALGVIIFMGVCAKLRIIFLCAEERLLVACQGREGIHHLNFLKKMGYLFIVFSPFFSSTENSGVGFLQQGPAKGKRKDNGCLFWGGGGKEVPISRKSTWVPFAF